MWIFLVRIIIRYRLALILIILGLTSFFAYKATQVELSYELAKMLPADDSLNVQYSFFKKKFGEDGNIIVVGIKNKDIYKIDQFNAWYDLGNSIKKIEGIEEVVSIARLSNIVKNDSLKIFQFKSVIKSKPKTQKEVDSLKKVIESLQLYKNFIYNKEKDCYLMAITLDKNKINDKSRVDLVNKVKEQVDDYSFKTNNNVHFSGLPYIRTKTTQKVKFELILFIILSIVVAAIIMIIFFKSFYAVVSSLFIVFISVIWGLGTISLFNYKITILTGVMPSLLVIIAIENCIYLINKYHFEYKKHGNKIKSISRIIHTIGFATLITNLTTAAGFFTFVFTSNYMLKEFGIVTSINIMLEYVFSIILIPIIFSYLPPPKQKHTKHLDSKIMRTFIDKILYVVLKKRVVIYAVSLFFIVVCCYGLTLMKTSGKVVDDLSEDDPIFVDLKFFENNFKGVMPFEIIIDTKEKNGVISEETLSKIDSLQKCLHQKSIFSKPLSLVELLKFSKQSYYNNDQMYELPSSGEIGYMSYIQKTLKQKTNNNQNLLHSFIDSNRQMTRISVQMADIGTNEVNKLIKDVNKDVDNIFEKDKYKITLTGNSIVYAKGTEFLIRNLFESVFIGILIISAIMALVFRSYRIIIIAMFCNIIPLMITAAIMGFFDVPVKPSTLIVFSVALGISIDNAILYLSKYRHELTLLNGNIKNSVVLSIKETGVSMIYTSIILVAGFAVFIVSDFGGTKALGLLISITLFLALLFNIFVLPSLLLSLDKIITTKTFKKPIIDIYENENKENSESILD